MAATTDQLTDVHALRAAVRGSVHVPGDEGYDAARTPFNLVVDQRPAVVVEAVDAQDVAAAVRFARDEGMQVMGQAGGHGASDEMAGTVIVRTNELRAITIDIGRETARVGAGVRWGQLMPLAGEYGLIGLCGSAADVGVVGYTLGGGISWFGRSYGYSANNVVSIELVDAGGELVVVRPETDPDLFWALRGGGGSFGIVTAIEIELKRAPQLFGGQIAWPAERAGEVMRAWREATEGAPREAALTLSIINVPPLPEIPEAIRGKGIVTVGLVHLGDEAGGRALLEPLYEAGGPPILDVMRPLTTGEIGFVAMDPEEPVPSEFRARMLGTLPDEALDRIAAAMREESALTMIQIRHLGGALAEPAPTHGAAGVLEGEYLVYGLGMVVVPELHEPIAAQLLELCASLAPWSAGRRPLTFTEWGDDLRETFGDAYDRLLAIKHDRDPDNVFRANHPIT